MSASILDIKPDNSRKHHYQVLTPIFEGPLDLLLQLIERVELDITKLSLAEVTDQFLAHLKHIKHLAAEEVSSFVVIAAKLIQIKSEVLLPKPPELEIDHEDPSIALIHQLRTYKLFKDASEYLMNRDSIGLRTYVRLAPPPHIDKTINLEEVTLEQLIKALEDAYHRIDETELGAVVKPPKITIREKIFHISNNLKEHNIVTFESLLTSRHRLDIVVTFLAVLELIKRRMVSVHQELQFGEIRIEQRGEWNGDLDFELEFGE